MSDHSLLAVVAVDGLCIVALASVCLVQYFSYSYRIGRERERNTELSQKAQTYQQEVRSLQRKQKLAEVERATMAAITDHDEFLPAIGELLRQMVAGSPHGVGLALGVAGERFFALTSRGLPAAVWPRLEGTMHDLQPLSLERPYHKTTWDTLLECPPLARLSSYGLPRSPLYVFSIRSAEQLVGVILSSTFLDELADDDEQLAAGERLVRGLAPAFRTYQVLDSQAQRLQSTEALLRLRAVTDRASATAIESVDEFLVALLQEVGAERCLLKLNLPRAERTWIRRVAEPGFALANGVLGQWKEIELRLADTGLLSYGIEWFDRERLRSLGIEALVGSAVTVPLMHRGQSLGTVCLTSRRGSFTPIAAELLDWSGRFLCDFLIRALNVAAMEKMAREDGLTELANRREFDDRLDKELESCRQTQAPCSLLLVDLDRFKGINDTFGHQAGDDVLKQTAELMRQEVASSRQPDRAVLARYGGEELAILLPLVPLAGALRLAEAIRHRVQSHHFESAGRTMPITLCVGVATFPQHGTTAEELIAAADSGLYDAKRNGRNRVGLPMEHAV